MDPLERAIFSRRVPTLYLEREKKSVAKSPRCQYARTYCNFWFSWSNFELHAIGEHHKIMLLYFLTISRTRRLCEFVERGRPQCHFDVMRWCMTMELVDICNFGGGGGDVFVTNKIAAVRDFILPFVLIARTNELQGLGIWSMIWR
jgi:hypothetical protein